MFTLAQDITDAEQQQHRFWMQQALLEAQKAEEVGEVPIGAVVVMNQTIIGRGFNHCIGLSDPCAHAEIQALQMAAKQVNNYRLVNADLYVTLEPCTMCWGAMVHARVARLIYGASEPKSGALCGQLNLHQQPSYNHRINIIAGIESSACSHLISSFFSNRRIEKKQAKNISSPNQNED
jgi:tRNA(adenine34) deaminase